MHCVLHRKYNPFNGNIMFNSVLVTILCKILYFDYIALASEIYPMMFSKPLLVFWITNGKSESWFVCWFHIYYKYIATEIVRRWYRCSKWLAHMCLLHKIWNLCVDVVIHLYTFLKIKKRSKFWIATRATVTEIFDIFSVWNSFISIES